ncbi:hypothetical protein [Nonomuraea wenchangensis]|uniref:hypothetical protein n=1 Tax=Nonomuraea wenchangensis TaxID=568860 RepID=UPI0033207935
MIKHSLANLASCNTGKLAAIVKTNLKRMQCRRGLLDVFIVRPASPSTAMASAFHLTGTWQ